MLDREGRGRAADPVLSRCWRAGRDGLCSGRGTGDSIVFVSGRGMSLIASEIRVEGRLSCWDGRAEVSSEGRRRPDIFDQTSKLEGIVVYGRGIFGDLECAE